MDEFKPVLGAADARRFLGELRLVDVGILAPEDTMLGVLPPFATAPLPERPVDGQVLRAVLPAIRERAALDALYQSMSRPTPARRLIEPHALAYDGFRWHARGSIAKPASSATSCSGGCRSRGSVSRPALRRATMPPGTASSRWSSHRIPA
jgi:hypothetical protein